MDSHQILQNILNPPILFFFLGVLATLVKSDLDIPQPLPKFFSYYLLLSIGFEAGVRITESGVSGSVFLVVVFAMAMASLVPLYAFFVLRRKLDVYNSAAIAATYGSVSAVTFITAAAFLQKLGIAYGGHMVAVMALMESPAIIIGVYLVRRFSPGKDSPAGSARSLWHDALLNSSVFLIVGSLLIGLLTGHRGWESLEPFSKGIFKGMLCLFLLDMGIVAAKRLRDLRRTGGFLIGFAIGVPVVNALVGICLSKALGLSIGDALLFTLLCGSASYIAVPAAMHIAVPQANPGLYVPMSLAVTFPFNIIVGIPFYSFLINWWWS